MSTDKIARDLQARLRSAPLDRPMGVIVRHREGAFSAQALRTSAEVTHRYRLVSAAAMRLRPSDLQALSQDDAVEYIWPDLSVHTCLDASVPRLRAVQVWAAGLRGEGVRIGVVDTGIDAHHADFAGRIAATSSHIGGDGTDDNGHGTHVAGIIAGSGAVSSGRYRGVAPAARLFVAKVLDHTGAGTMSGVMAGIEWAVEQGVQVINLSLGTEDPSDGSDALSTLCDQVVRQTGTLICTAVGNYGPDPCSVSAPGCARWVVTVGALDGNDKVPDFSSRGPTSDGRVKPDVVCPGTGIVSAQARGTALGPVVGPGYVRLSGTSMAAPFATGAVALLLQAQPNLRPDQLKYVLLASTVNLGDSPNAQGSGRVDAFAAYRKVSAGALGQPRQASPNPPAAASSWMERVIRALRSG